MEGIEKLWREIIAEMRKIIVEIVIEIEKNIILKNLKENVIFVINMGIMQEIVVNQEEDMQIQENHMDNIIIDIEEVEVEVGVGRGIIIIHIEEDLGEMN